MLHCQNDIDSYLRSLKLEYGFFGSIRLIY